MNYIKQVKEFMTTFDQPTPETIINIPEDRNKLRIALIFEELREYAEASGLKGYFAYELCKKHSNDIADGEVIDENINKVEQLDALLDLQYVLSGAVIEHGFDTVFDKGFEEVHRSNMTKAIKSAEDLDNTLELHDLKGEYAFSTKSTEYPTVLYRHPDMKVIKSASYSPANLKSILNIK